MSSISAVSTAVPNASHPPIDEKCPFNKCPTEVQDEILSQCLAIREKVIIEMYYDEDEGCWMVAKEPKSVHPFLVTSWRLRRLFLKKAQIVSKNPTVYYHPLANIIYLAHRKGSSRLYAPVIDKLKTKNGGIRFFPNLTEIALAYHCLNGLTTMPWVDANLNSKLAGHIAKERQGAKGILWVADRVYKVLPNLKKIVIIQEPRLVAESGTRDYPGYRDHENLQYSVERLTLEESRTVTGSTPSANGFEEWLRNLASQQFKTHGPNGRDYTFNLPPIEARRINRLRLSPAEILAARGIRELPVENEEEGYHSNSDEEEWDEEEWYHSNWAYDNSD